MDQYQTDPDQSAVKPTPLPRRDEDLVQRMSDLEVQIRDHKDQIVRLRREIRRLSDSVASLTARVWNRG